MHLQPGVDEHVIGKKELEQNHMEKSDFEEIKEITEFQSAPCRHGNKTESKQQVEVLQLISEKGQTEVTEVSSTFLHDKENEDSQKTSSQIATQETVHTSYDKQLQDEKDQENVLPDENSTMQTLISDNKGTEDVNKVERMEEPAQMVEAQDDLQQTKINSSKAPLASDHTLTNTADKDAIVSSHNDTNIVDESQPTYKSKLVRQRSYTLPKSSMFSSSSAVDSTNELKQRFERLKHKPQDIESRVESIRNTERNTGNREIAPELAAKFKRLSKH